MKLTPRLLESGGEIFDVEIQAGAGRRSAGQDGLRGCKASNGYSEG